MSSESSIEYNNSLTHEEQINAEEDITRIIHEYEYAEDATMRPSEEDCQTLSQQILLYILERFRPDLIEGHEEESMEPSIAGDSFTCVHCKTVLHFPTDEFTHEEAIQQLQAHIIAEFGTGAGDMSVEAIGNHFESCDPV